ncbi:MAG: sugar transferase [Rhodomicrobium sp.]|nr:sugar transferase [Rhodomicrobium sp.]
MVSVPELTASRGAENHGEPLVNRHSVLLRGRDKTDKTAGERKSAIHRFAVAGSPSLSSDHAGFAGELFHHAAPVGGRAKRLFDIVIASTTLVVMAPIMILLAAFIYLTMGRPVFFVQQRVGFKGKIFGCFKYRTMVKDADERLAKHLACCPEAERAWTETQKLRHDPRVTVLGQILRKSSLDELPQLFNILRGDMSCIGPRPVIREELERYGSHVEDYARAKPGLTGMWQVSGRSKTSYAHRVKCDRYYVRRWSMLLDFNILIRTIPAILKFDETA